jgi:hypothetical protein
VATRGIVSRAELERRGIPTHRRILDLGYQTRCLRCRRKGDVIELSVITLNNVPAVLPRT